eukprot:Colp12_sorted_trinity150504_noHs@33743
MANIPSFNLENGLSVDQVNQTVPFSQGEVRRMVGYSDSCGRFIFISIIKADFVLRNRKENKQCKRCREAKCCDQQLIPPADFENGFVTWHDCLKIAAVLLGLNSETVKWSDDDPEHGVRQRSPKNIAKAIKEKLDEACHKKHLSRQVLTEKFGTDHEPVRCYPTKSTHPTHDVFLFNVRLDQQLWAACGDIQGSVAVPNSVSTSSSWVDMGFSPSAGLANLYLKESPLVYASSAPTPR